MKNTAYKIALLSLLGIFAGGFSAMAQSSPDSGSMFSAESNASDSISGKVTAVTDTALVVDGKTVAVTDSTSFIADGKVIKIDDINAGDEVKVSTTTGEGGVLQAVTVEVVPARE